MLDLRPHFGLNLGEKTIEKRRKEEKREEEEEEEKKKRREEERKIKKRYGTMTISMDTCFGLYGATFDIRISCLAFDLSRVLLGFHPNPRFLENRGGKTLNGAR